MLIQYILNRRGTHSLSLNKPGAFPGMSPCVPGFDHEIPIIRMIGVSAPEMENKNANSHSE